MKEEKCYLCDDPTGKAGKGEDSLYIGDQGPLCDDCHRIVLESTVDFLTREQMLLREVIEVADELIRSDDDIQAMAKYAAVRKKLFEWDSPVKLVPKT